MKDSTTVVLILAAVVILAALIGGGCYSYPKYQVYKKTLDGQAVFKEAEYSRQVAVEEARARLESSKFDAQAEIERAYGVAKANEIIGDSLQGNEAYLQYLWIQGLHDGNTETIYIPTEGNLPLPEAGRRLEPRRVPDPAK